MSTLEKALVQSILGNNEAALDLIDPPTEEETISFEQGIASAQLLMNCG